MTYESGQAAPPPRRGRGALPWLIGVAVALIAIILAAVACNVTGTPNAGGTTTTTAAAPSATSSGGVVVPPPSDTSGPPVTTTNAPPSTTAVTPPPTTGPTSTPATAHPTPPKGVNAGSGGEGDSSGPLSGGGLLLLLFGAGAIAAGVTMVRRSA